MVGGQPSRVWRLLELNDLQKRQLFVHPRRGAYRIGDAGRWDGGRLHRDPRLPPARPQRAGAHPHAAAQWTLANINEFIHRQKSKRKVRDFPHIAEAEREEPWFGTATGNP